jgi:hypothetical protein
MEQIKNKNQTNENNPDKDGKNNNESISTTTTNTNKSDQLDLKKLITKIDNRVKTKVNNNLLKNHINN